MTARNSRPDTFDRAVLLLLAFVVGLLGVLFVACPSDAPTGCPSGSHPSDEYMRKCSAEWSVATCLDLIDVDHGCVWEAQ